MCVRGGGVSFTVVGQLKSGLQVSSATYTQGSNIRLCVSVCGCLLPYLLLFTIYTVKSIDACICIYTFYNSPIVL